MCLAESGHPYHASRASLCVCTRHAEELVTSFAYIFIFDRSPEKKLSE